MDKLLSLKIFIASTEAGSFAAAAKTLGTDPSTVSKAVRRLEQELNVRLFQRNTRAMALTAAGNDYLATARTIVNLLEQTERDLQETDTHPKGILRINAPLSFGRQYMAPLLKGFRERYPNIHCQLSFSDRHVDTIGQQFDITIRTGNVKDSQMVVRKLAPMDFIICAGREMAKRLPKKLDIEQFSSFPWIRYRFQQSGKLQPIIWSSETGTLDLDPDVSCIVDDADIMVDLCAMNLGLCQAPHFCVKTQLDNGHLIPLFPCYQDAEAGTYLLYPKRSMLPARTRVFIEYMVETLERMGETGTATWARSLRTLYNNQGRRR